MTAFNDFDRVLDQWLDEGPNRAPDRPIELAVEHARSHPRRRDPLRFLRPDPMGRRAPGLPLRPVMILAALGLLLGAMFALGVGGRPQPAIVGPTPSTSAAPSVRTFDVELTVPEASRRPSRSSTGSGLVVEALTGTPTGEAGQSFPDDAVDVSNVDGTTLQLGWAGFPCQTDHTLTIEADGRTMTLKRPACIGDTDAIGVDRILILKILGASHGRRRDGRARALKTAGRDQAGGGASTGGAASLGGGASTIRGFSGTASGGARTRANGCRRDWPGRIGYWPHRQGSSDALPRIRGSRCRRCVSNPARRRTSIEHGTAAVG